MKTDEFAYWLQGAIEMNPEMLEKGMTPEQVKTIQDHLNLVFKKVTPDRMIPSKVLEDSLKISSEEKQKLMFTQYPNNGGTYCSPSTDSDIPQAVAIC